MHDSKMPQAIAPTLFLSDCDVASITDWSAAVAALADAYAHPTSDAMVPPRSMARGDGFWLRSLTAVSPAGGHMGCKLIAASMRARCASYLIALFNQQTMALSALIDGNRVTGLRTAATAALAIDLLAPQRTLRVGVIGAGFEARGALDCLMSVREVARVRVFSPTPASRERFAESFRPALDIEALNSAQEAVQDCDVVICAARSRDESAVLQGAWLPAGVTVVSLGSTLPEQREVDVVTMERAVCIVADMPQEVLHDTGDGIAAVSAGVKVAEKLIPLADLVAGCVQPRRNESDIVLYKSVGSALQDVVIAQMLYERAKQQGLGIDLPASIVPVSK
ncbi:NAD(P)-binding domain-containing protein [Pseudomonas hefeiensis]|uniref:NAD(P)-binding domain-containing protein n=1 Tax=Pseudomonas hefeiensis TaxID=2738125 RepID=A0ABY9GH41_9PSED|nr:MULTISPECIES: NAD(P)-binding domain-containing protein [unclassified Pseudomonas]WLH14755.1 NAD(P)-binding domain-containing protein [Pseudomonas sp. FP205]WLH97808.1 NAD(P)-binding domain-containing protein [Pseudomonas sp. FP53]WLI42082.1 NAD(P)-binding domain-containing protein [Pseudomonas sp. FP821]